VGSGGHPGGGPLTGKKSGKQSLAITLSISENNRRRCSLTQIGDIALKRTVQPVVKKRTRGSQGKDLSGRVTADYLEDKIMRNSLKTTAAAFMLAAVTGLTGCATTRDLDALKLEVDKANAAASQAASDAAAARAKADAAQQCCNANSEKMDRMFKQSMNK